MTSTETVLVSEVIPASRHAIYSAWLDTRQHSAFTGDTAVIEPAIGGRHSTFGGYASGTMLELEPHRRIVLSWRSTEFPEGSPDSRLEVTLEDTAGGTLVTILHTQIPEGQGDRYKDGWIQYYLEPLKRYFSKRVSNGVNGHRYGLAYAEKEDHVGDNERENDDEMQMQGETDDQSEDAEDGDDQEQGDADMDDDTVLAAGEQDDMDEDREDLTLAQGDDDDDDQDEEAEDDTVEVGADAIQEVSSDNAQRVVARPLEDDVRSPVVVEDMTGGYDDEKPAKARPAAKPAKAKAKAAARKPPAKKVVKPAAKKAAPKKAAKKATTSAKAAKKAAKPAKKAARVVARAGKAAKGKKAAPKKAAAKRPKAKAKTKKRR